MDFLALLQKDATLQEFTKLKQIPVVAVFRNFAQVAPYEGDYSDTKAMMLHIMETSTDLVVRT